MISDGVSRDYWLRITWLLYCVSREHLPYITWLLIVYHVITDHTSCDHWLIITWSLTVSRELWQRSITDRWLRCCITWSFNFITYHVINLYELYHVITMSYTTWRNAGKAGRYLSIVRGLYGSFDSQHFTQRVLVPVFDFKILPRRPKRCLRL